MGSSRARKGIWINGFYQEPEPKAVLQTILMQFTDLQYRSKDNLYQVFCKAYFMAKEVAQEFKGAKYTRFLTLSNRKLKNLERSYPYRDRESMLKMVYEELLACEGLAPLRGFGFSNKFGDSIPGNSEWQSILTAGGDKMPVVEKEKEMKRNQLKGEVIMTTLKRNQLVDAAKDLNETIGLDPEIDISTKTKVGKIKEQILEASELIEPSDEISDKTKETLKQLGGKLPSKDQDGEAKQEKEKGEETKETTAAEVEKEEDGTYNKEEEKQPTEKKKPASNTSGAEKPKGSFPKREGSMSEFVDKLMEKEEKLDAIIETATAEAKSRDLKTMHTPGAIKGHIRYRKKKGYKSAQNYDV